MHFEHGVTEPAHMAALGRSCPALEALLRMTGLTIFALMCYLTIPPDLEAWAAATIWSALRSAVAPVSGLGRPRDR
ncbi:hypothetical protein PAPYR_5887 [Paratrimastix pyriformis]|uniref:Uncharacterized protein n=1 Tax=Paratrimastix pyriformis TaxID=342808 RepID=A0ABQ8ULX0_9EUKA|nr:hypothetical protein PAPYR_5887 [Paratrimastix pyriformis]